MIWAFLCPKIDSNGPFHYAFRVGIRSQIIAFVVIDGYYLHFNTADTHDPDPVTRLTHTTQPL
jgi:hypothetical protein